MTRSVQAPLPDIVLVNGLPGSGKSTVARELVRRFPRAALVEGDFLQHAMTATGLVGPGAEPAEESARQLTLRWRNIASLCRNFTDEDFLVVVDSLTTPGLLQGLVTDLPDLRVAYVHLAPDRGVSLARDASRTEKTIGDQFDWIAPELEELRACGVWIDSTTQSVRQTVQAADGAVRTGAAMLPQSLSLAVRTRPDMAPNLPPVGRVR